MEDADTPPPPQEEHTSASTEQYFLESRIAKLEAKLDERELSAEAKYRALLITEIRQRIIVRYAAVAVSCIVIVLMVVVALYAAHRYFWGHFILVPTAAVIAMFVAPIVAISTITIMLLIGAFRRFKDDDIDNVNVPSLAVEAGKAVIK